LRDLANNFISGILLLIERPIKVGDHVTIGGFEGEVRHLGVRSIVITNDDHQELLVPNADIFSKSFINWTHHDSIVRKFFILRVSREDNPHQVKEIILDVLENMQLVEASPKPSVYLLKMEDMLLQFTIEYYIDMRKVRSRDTLQSKILLAIYDQFKAHGIHAPEYPREIKLLS
jgi:potassium efflux system protein